MFSDLAPFAPRHDSCYLFFNDQGDSRGKGIGKDEGNEEREYGGGGGGERELHIFSLLMTMRDSQ